MDEMFGKSDQNADGKVSKEEFMNSIPKERMEMFFKMKDKDSNGELSKEEFTTRPEWGQEKGRFHPDFNPKEHFKKVDSNADGKVSKDEFIQGAPEKAPQDKVEKFFNFKDKDSNGELSEEEFCAKHERGSHEHSQKPEKGADSPENKKPE
jgi:Ca2+-binding EF-hand superfamily protein